jgi:hypothetical protein
MQQHNQEAPVLDFEHLPDLPARITMGDGQIIDVADYVWRMTVRADLPTPLTIDWNSVLNVTTSETSIKYSPLSRPKSGQFKVMFAASFKPCR